MVDVPGPEGINGSIPYIPLRAQLCQNLLVQHKRYRSILAT